MSLNRATSLVSPGFRFGSLVVLSMGLNERKRVSAECRCDCGKVKLLEASYIATGHTKSCGCGKNLGCRRTHGQGSVRARSRIYATWSRMKERCSRPGARDWDRYGGRGIAVCERWLSFENFFADMGHHPGRGMSLDRIDNNRGYEPGNVRWATAAEQANNRSSNVRIVVDGIEDTATNHARRVGINPDVVIARLWNGWDPGRAIKTTPRKLPPRGKRCH